MFSLFSLLCFSRSHSFSSFVVFALWANFWLLVGFQICGKSEVRRKLNELAPARGGQWGAARRRRIVLLRFLVVFPFAASFIYLHAVCFSASCQHFLLLIFFACFLFLPPPHLHIHNFFPPDLAVCFMV